MCAHFFFQAKKRINEKLQLLKLLMLRNIHKIVKLTKNEHSMLSKLHTYQNKKIRKKGYSYCNV